MGDWQGRTIVRAACGKVNLDRRGPPWVALPPHGTGIYSNAANISSPQSPADQQARIPGPDGHTLGSRDAVTSPEEGPQAYRDLDAHQARLTASERLPRGYRLARPADLRRCLEKGVRRGTRHLDFFWIDNSVGHPRIGLLVPRFQATAVARNRLRRRLREVWRREVRSGQPARDLVIRAKREAYRASFTTLRSEVLLWRDSVAAS